MECGILDSHEDPFQASYSNFLVLKVIDSNKENFLV